MAASLSFQSANSNIGGAAFTCASAVGQERLVAILGIAQSPITSSGWTAVTIDGQTATQVGSTSRQTDPANNGPIISFWRAPGTSGTSIVVTATPAGSFFDVRGLLWTLSDAGTLLDHNEAGYSSAGGTQATLTVSVNTAAGGTAAAAFLGYDSSSHDVTWTGLTERVDATNSLYGGDWTSAADLNTGSASTPLTVTAATPATTFASNSAIVAAAVSFNPAATGTTLAADAGSYAITGSDAGLVASSSLVADAGAYAITGSDVTFAASGNVTFFCASGEYTLSGSAVTFPGAELPPEPAPSPGAGSYAGALYRPYRFGKKRKREDEEPPPPVYPPDLPAPPRSPSPPDLPAPPLHTLIDLAPPARGPAPKLTRAAKPTVADDEDDDAEAIAVLLKLLS